MKKLTSMLLSTAAVLLLLQGQLSAAAHDVPEAAHPLSQDQVLALIPEGRFGGLYYDPLGTAHINVTPGPPLPVPTGDAPVVFHTVDHSLSYLQKLADSLTTLMPEYHIALLDANDRTNQVDVVFQDGYYDEDVIRAILEHTGISADSGIFSFSALAPGTSIQFTVLEGPPADLHRIPALSPGSPDPGSSPHPLGGKVLCTAEQLDPDRSRRQFAPL